MSGVKRGERKDCSPGRDSQTGGRSTTNQLFHWGWAECASVLQARGPPLYKGLGLSLLQVGLYLQGPRGPHTLWVLGRQKSPRLRIESVLQQEWRAMHVWRALLLLRAGCVGGGLLQRAGWLVEARLCPCPGPLVLAVGGHIILVSGRHPHCLVIRECSTNR